MQGDWVNLTPVTSEEAKSFVEEHGFVYLGPLTSPSYREDPHHTQCRRCGKISGWAFGRHYASESARRNTLPAWLHFYNQHRPHTAIGKVPPITRLNNLPGHYN